MSKAIHRRRAARRDLVDILRCYTREAGLRVAERFLAQAEATSARLASLPGIGAHYNHPALAELRYFPSLVSQNPSFSTDPSRKASRSFVPR